MSTKNKSVQYGKIIYGKTMMSKNTTCYLSEIGHNNFYYPTCSRAILKKNCNYEELPWLCSQPLKAIKTKISCLSPLSLDKDSVDDIIFNDNPDKVIIVWVDKNIAP